MKTNAAKICVPVCVPCASELSHAIARAAQVGDIIELRLDCLLAGELDSLKSVSSSLIGDAGAPIMLTMRGGEQGGRASLNLDQRSQFWSSIGATSENCLKDFELDLVQEYQRRADARVDWSNVICSHHDFAGVPSNLEQIYEQMAATDRKSTRLNSSHRL